MPARARPGEVLPLRRRRGQGAGEKAAGAVRPASRGRPRECVACVGGAGGRAVRGAARQTRIKRRTAVAAVSSAAARSGQRCCRGNGGGVEAGTAGRLRHTAPVAQVSDGHLAKVFFSYWREFRAKQCVADLREQLCQHESRAARRLAALRRYYECQKIASAASLKLQMRCFGGWIALQRRGRRRRDRVRREAAALPAKALEELTRAAPASSPRSGAEWPDPLAVAAGQRLSVAPPHRSTAPAVRSGADAAAAALRLFGGLASPRAGRPSGSPLRLQSEGRPPRRRESPRRSHSRGSAAAANRPQWHVPRITARTFEEYLQPRRTQAAASWEAEAADGPTVQPPAQPSPPEPDVCPPPQLDAAPAARQPQGRRTPPHLRAPWLRAEDAARASSVDAQPEPQQPPLSWDSSPAASVRASQHRSPPASRPVTPPPHGCAAGRWPGGRRDEELQSMRQLRGMERAASSAAQRAKVMQERERLASTLDVTTPRAGHGPVLQQLRARYGYSSPDGYGRAERQSPFTRRERALARCGVVATPPPAVHDGSGKLSPPPPATAPDGARQSPSRHSTQRPSSQHGDAKVCRMSKESVQRWLCLTGFNEFARSFAAAGIGGPQLLELTGQVLRRRFDMSADDRSYFLQQRDRLRAVAASS
eukprot:TRINITY_DN29635_c0_g1_i1.p1 TRINITY_DN29635_c0_g1~~TRINITY_DN29635_c0_g1_i1.p1  ORF type:complete len:650 (+),score=148.70 TRINITY_DN29635_c0_g1_i1:663-2612(+)